MVTLAKRCLGDGAEIAPHITDRKNFGPDKKRQDKLCPYCRECNASRQRRWKHANPEKVRTAKREYQRLQRAMDANAR